MNGSHASIYHGKPHKKAECIYILYYKKRVHLFTSTTNASPAPRPVFVQCHRPDSYSVHLYKVVVEQVDVAVRRGSGTWQ